MPAAADLIFAGAIALKETYGEVRRLTLLKKETKIKKVPLKSFPFEHKLTFIKVIQIKC